MGLLCLTQGLHQPVPEGGVGPRWGGEAPGDIRDGEMGMLKWAVIMERGEEQSGG